MANMKVEKVLMILSYVALFSSFFMGPLFWIVFPLALALSIVVSALVAYKVRAVIALKRIEALSEALEELRHDRRDKGRG